MGKRRFWLGCGALGVWVVAACTQLAGVEDGKLAGASSGGTAAGGGSGAGASGGSAGSSAGAGGNGGVAGGASGAGGTGSGGSNGGTGGTSTSSKYAQAVLADGPLGYWRLGEAVGATTAIDASGNGNDGVLKGTVKLGEPGALASDSDTAVFFDGASYIDMGDKFDFAGTAKFTLEAWVYPQVDDRGFLGKTFDDGLTRGYMLAEGSLALQFIRENANIGTPSLSQTAFTHLVATYDGLNMVIYINGSKAKSAPYANSVSDHTTSFIIGKAVDWGSMLGWIDEVAVYDKALDEVRVQAHFAASKP